MGFIVFKKIVRRMSEIKTEDDLVCCFSDINHAFDAELISFSEYEMLYALAEKIKLTPQFTSVGMQLDRTSRYTSQPRFSHRVR